MEKPKKINKGRILVPFFFFGEYRGKSSGHAWTKDKQYAMCEREREGGRDMRVTFKPIKSDSYITIFFIWDMHVISWVLCN